MKPKRPSILKSIETDILVQSRRRCCLCVFLQSDISEKQIQIAHLDKNNRNNKPQNLVALCLDHHDKFDSITSQSKGYKPHEIKYYRDKLYKIIKDKDAQTINQILNDRKNNLNDTLPSLEDNEKPVEQEGLLGRFIKIHFPVPYAIAVMDVCGVINLPKITDLFGMDYEKSLFGVFSFVKKVLNTAVTNHPEISNLGLVDDSILLASPNIDELLLCIKDISKVTDGKIQKIDKHLTNILRYRSGISWVDNSAEDCFKPVKAGILAFRISDKIFGKAGQIYITNAVYKQLSLKNRSTFKETNETSEQGNLFLLV